MKVKPRQNNFHQDLAVAVIVTFVFLAKVSGAETMMFHLRTGEKIAGTIVSENTNRIVISNLWAKEFSIPIAQIEKRETNVVVNNPASPVTTNAPAKTAAATNAVVATIAISKTNAPVKPAAPRLWHGEVRLGMDLLYNSVNRQIYNARVKLTYARPYPEHPAKFFRNSIDLLYEYGETETKTIVNGQKRTDFVRSANRMEGSDKIDFDLGKKTFVYNLFGAGYDEIRKIDLHYELGPGAGYHLFALTNFAMNIESGVNYQVQERSTGENVRNFYFRLAEDFTWKIALTDQQRKAVRPPITLTEKFEIFPLVESPNEFRSRFESTLAIPLLKNLSFNFSVIDLYDTRPAKNVSENELQVRSSIGVTF